MNANEPYYEGQPYGSTPGAALTADFGPSFDAARRHLGAPWRMPSTEEYKELFDNCDFIDADGNIVSASTSVAGTAADKRITMNGIVGLRLRSKINGNVIFFPASGSGVGTTWDRRGANGYYWSSSWYSTTVLRFVRSSNTSGQNQTHPEEFALATLLHSRHPGGLAAGVRVRTRQRNQPKC